MNSRFLQFAILIALSLSANLSFSALANTNKDVGRIDLMKTRTIIWVSGPMTSQPEECNSYTAATCDNTEKFCDLMLSTALAAKLAGKQIEFGFSGECAGSWAEVDRFRMMD